ncbi:ADP-ribosylation factor 4 [Conglomerata obtusa]
MGKLFSRLQDIFTTKQMKEISIVGLDNAGKTTILYSMKHHNFVETIPTIGFNVESFTVGKATFNVWDIGGQDEIRVLWLNYIEMSSGIIFVVDITDTERYEKAGMELKRIMKESEFKTKPVLILANKADDPTSHDYESMMERMVDKMGIKEDGFRYAVRHCSALKCKTNPEPLERLVPAFEWIGEEMNKS